MKRTISTLFGAVLLCAGTLSAAAEIDVMTQNQYLGADLTPLLAATSTDEFNAALVVTLKKIAAARPAERVQALAAQIARRRPDAVGLQEAYRFACTAFPGQSPGTGCDHPELRGAFSDQLLATETALRGRYKVAGRVTNLAVPAIPFFYEGAWAVLEVADRDAILVRSDLPASPVPLAAMSGCTLSDDGCNFATAPELPTPLGPISLKRGYLAVDLSVKGQPYRLFNTHLEQRELVPGMTETRLIQVGQAAELLGTAMGTWDGLRRLLVVGDFNSDPVDEIPGAPTPYQVFTQIGGFTDAWTLRPQASDAGFSCCQAEDLLNRRSELYERIDMIFSLTPPSSVLDMKLLGTTMGDKTRPPGIGGLWPSDHAAVAAKLKFD